MAPKQPEQRPASGVTHMVVAKDSSGEFGRSAKFPAPPIVGVPAGTEVPVPTALLGVAYPTVEATPPVPAEGTAGA